MTSALQKNQGLYRITPGYTYPFGVSRQEGGINFSLYVKHATGVTLCLFTDPSQPPLHEIPFDPEHHNTGYVWHLLIHDLPEGFYYGYRLEGSGDPHHRYDPNVIVLDPYAKEVSTSSDWGIDTQLSEPERYVYQPLGAVLTRHEFDWEGVVAPKLALKDLVIYEMHVRGFTQHDSSQVAHPGTFLGMVEKIPYLADLGVNAVELLPVYEFNERENYRISPITQKDLYNYWGYSTVSFFSPMRRYATHPAMGASLHEFKTLVKELHRHGIQVILDVVYNHTGEGNGLGPTLSFKGIDNAIYYMLDSEGAYRDYTGCGNTFNCNHPVVREFIRDSLRYWVTEMHVDGFRFDLASTLTRDRHGTPLESPPLIESLSHDPILAKAHLIAEPWDAGGLYQVGSFYTEESRWSEWNGKYRDVTRRFIKGSPGEKREFATRICGSQDLYGNGRSPTSSINFITAHDGFSLRDLVSYNRKHNLNNGEDNRDGCNFNDSWNCGAEGKSINKRVLLLRERQIRNFHLALMVSQGVPMIQMGDEYSHTRYGNNNVWCQDNALSWFLWDQIDLHQDFFRYYRGLIHFRHQHALLRQGRFLIEGDIEWHGSHPDHPDWDEDNAFLAFTLKDPNQQHLYVAFNIHHQAITIELPPCAEGMAWHFVANTASPAPLDFIEEEERIPYRSGKVKMISHSAILLKQSKLPENV